MRRRNEIKFYFISGNEEDYLNVAIKDGGISLLMKVTTGKLDIYIKPNRVRFDDYRWHKVTVHRRIKEVSDFILILFIFKASQFDIVNTYVKNIMI